MNQLWNNIDASQKKIREFGLVIFAVVGLIIPAIIFYKHGIQLTNTVTVLFGGGLLFLGATYTLQKLMTPIYKIWMILAIGMGFIMTRVIITIVYMLLFTPIGIIRRMIGSKTPKEIRNYKYGNLDSYWIQREDPYTKESTERQF